MIHDPTNAMAATSPSDTKLRSLLGVMSVFTMIMTVPQVWAIWVGQQAAGVSILSWSAYLEQVVFPPGRARLSTKPMPTGSPTFANTMGTVRVARCSA
jgi:hypothetical protein